MRDAATRRSETSGEASKRAMHSGTFAQTNALACAGKAARESPTRPALTGGRPRALATAGAGSRSKAGAEACARRARLLGPAALDASHLAHVPSGWEVGCVKRRGIIACGLFACVTMAF